VQVRLLTIRRARLASQNPRLVQLVAQPRLEAPSLQHSEAPVARLRLAVGARLAAGEPLDNRHHSHNKVRLVAEVLCSSHRGLGLGVSMLFTILSFPDDFDSDIPCISVHVCCSHYRDSQSAIPRDSRT